MSKTLRRIAYAVFLLILAEIVAQALFFARVGVWPIADGGPYGAGVFEPHPFLVGVPRAGAHASRGAVNVTIDSLGFRGPDISVERPAGTLRVLTLGGSTTFAVGVTDTDTWCWRLQAALDSLLPSSGLPFTRAEVINGGVPGFTSAESIIEFALRGVHLRPQVVLVFQGFNDMRVAHSPGLRSDYTNFHPMTQPGNLELNRLRHGMRFGLVRLGRWALARAFAEPEPSVPAAPRRGGPDSAALSIFRDNLTTLAGICRSHDMHCLFVPQLVTDGIPMNQQWLPYLDPAALQSTLDMYNDMMASVATPLGVPFAGEVTTYNWTVADFRDFVHFNPAGNQRFASLIAPRVIEAARTNAQ